MPLIRREGDNVGDCKGAIGIVPYEHESAAFDALGPQLRLALNEVPVKILAYPLLQECLAMGVDPREPKIDAMAAANIRLGAKSILLQDRSPEDAELGLRPLRVHRVRKRR